MKYFIKIVLSHTVSEMNVILRFTQKFKMAIKNGRNMNLTKLPDDSSGYRGVKKIAKIAPCGIVANINVFLHYTQKFKKIFGTNGRLLCVSVKYHQNLAPFRR